MSKILLINPNKRLYSYTPIWIASHTGILKHYGHNVKLFDATFYKKWGHNYLEKLTSNKIYKPSDYESYIQYNDNDIYVDLNRTIEKFRPDIIFWSAISSHIHSEGEYSNIQYGYELLSKVDTGNIIKITGGLQPTANPYLMFEIFPDVDYFISGESEFVLTEIACNIYGDIKGLNRRGCNTVDIKRQKIIDMELLPFYDYSLFDEQVFYRPYNGKIVKAVDYEMSRGCPYTCNYCVESVIQKYYNLHGMKYFRHKNAEQIFEEVKSIHDKHGVTYFRCQDTNFLSIPRKVLEELADLISGLPIFFYIETRPDTIKEDVIPLLLKLHIDGIGMGIETASEDFRRAGLNRIVKQSDIIEAFRLLKNTGIKRTTYNIIGLPGQTEEMILDTIKFNRLLNPDNISVTYYSPFMGTTDNKKYIYDLDEDTHPYKSTTISKEKLEFYRQNFVGLVRNG